MNVTELTTAVYIGPASVVRVERGRVRLAMPFGEAEAELALAYPYRPRRGDVVLVCGDGEYYVIGVLRGRGVSSISLPGDAEIRAGGKLRIVGGQTVEIESPNVRLRADRLETAARAVFERAVDSYRWVKGVMQTTAGRARTLVAGSSTLHAERILETARKDVKIDGKRIHLG